MWAEYTERELQKDKHIDVLPWNLEIIEEAAIFCDRCEEELDIHGRCEGCWECNKCEINLDANGRCPECKTGEALR